MGFLGGLFGRSRDREAVAKDRCMECGMTKGVHTDWCPAAADAAPTQEASSANEDAGSDIATPPT